MAEQWKTGLVTITNGSQIVVGTASCDWANQISLPAIFKVDLDNETTISVGTIISATRLHLAANYTGSTNSGMSYMLCRSFSSSRGYWRPLQGDSDFAEILSQETIDPIDEDIAHIMSGNATVDGTIGTSFGIDTDGNCLRIKSTNLTASRYYHFPNKNASIPSGADITRANASIDDIQTIIVANPQLKTANYQILTTDNMILASGNVAITLASASSKHEIRIGNRSLNSNASIRVKKSGGDTIESNASLMLANKHDTVCLIGDGTNTHLQF